MGIPNISCVMEMFHSLFVFHVSEKKPKTKSRVLFLVFAFKAENFLSVFENIEFLSFARETYFFQICLIDFSRVSKKSPLIFSSFPFPFSRTGGDLLSFLKLHIISNNLIAASRTIQKKIKEEEGRNCAFMKMCKKKKQSKERRLRVNM